MAIASTTNKSSTPAFPTFKNTFATLGDAFSASVQAQPLKSSYLIAANEPLAEQLGIAPSLIRHDFFRQIFSGEKLADGSQSIAAVYSGHQFGVWAGQLGDGRALLLGDIKLQEPDSNSYSRYEIQLKGAGPTPFSRMGDGRAVLRSSLREYLCSEAMNALGIPSSRALSLIGSDQYAMREQPEKTAIVARVAPSFIRFGSFEHWYYNDEHEKLKQLADFCLEHYFSSCLVEENPYQAMLKNIVRLTAEMIAHWQAVGFMHGVMNTDNMSILGLTLDYGPFGFMDGYQPQQICNHSDTQGRYAFHMQPRIGQWNCNALAQAMLPLIGDVNAAQEALATYVPSFEQKHAQLMAAKFGFQRTQDGDLDLISDFLDIMAKGNTDYTNSFRALSNYKLAPVSLENEKLRDLFLDRESLDKWLERYKTRLITEQSNDEQREITMKRRNPKFVLRNYLAQQAIEAAENKDFSELERLYTVLLHPFDEQKELENYAALPPDWAQTISVSCSS